VNDEDSLVVVIARVGMEVREGLDTMARERGVSRSDVMRDLLRRGMAQYRQEQELLQCARATSVAAG